MNLRSHSTRKELMLAALVCCYQLLALECQALPSENHLQLIKKEFKRDIEPTKVDCRVEKCRHELSLEEEESGNLLELPAKLMSCLNNCASCVRQWKGGVYKGRECANSCLNQEPAQQVDSMDPDCNQIKYLDERVLTGVAGI